MGLSSAWAESLGRLLGAPRVLPTTRVVDRKYAPNSGPPLALWGGGRCCSTAPVGRQNLVLSTSCLGCRRSP
jgi:hypothetical protein